jgi:hypothetical protein
VEDLSIPKGLAALTDPVNETRRSSEQDSRSHLICDTLLTERSLHEPSHEYVAACKCRDERSLLLRYEILQPEIYLNKI